MHRSVPQCLAVPAIMMILTMTAGAEPAGPPALERDELAADLQLLQGSWELVATPEGQASPAVRSIKTIDGNRETVRRYRLPSGELATEQTVEFTLGKSGDVRVFTFFPVGGTAAEGKSYVYRVDDDCFYDVPGLLDDKRYDNYQVLPKVWRWKRIDPQANIEINASRLLTKQAPTTPGIVGASPAVVEAGDTKRSPKAARRDREIPHWGKVVDPNDDCKVDANLLSMLVPPTNHDLSPLRGLSAPRVLRTVTGDFEVSVKVTADFRPGTTAKGKGRPFNGAGLVIWQDAENFLRIERNAWWDGESYLCYPPLIEYWRDRQYSGANNAPVSSSEFFHGDSTWLKAVRRGDRITVSMSHDGTKWTEVKTVVVKLDSRLQVGVAALNTSDQPFRVEFADLVLKTE